MSGEKARGETPRSATAEVPAIIPARDLDQSQRRTAPTRRPATRFADKAGDELSEEQIETLRRRIADGAYNSREVAEEVARRLLESGDL
jgi:hypothetical protein